MVFESGSFSFFSRLYKCVYTIHGDFWCFVDVSWFYIRTGSVTITCCPYLFECLVFFFANLYHRATSFSDFGPNQSYYKCLILLWESLYLPTNDGISNSYPTLGAVKSF